MNFSARKISFAIQLIIPILLTIFPTKILSEVTSKGVPQPNEFKLLLSGGGLAFCSNFKPQFCSKNTTNDFTVQPGSTKYTLSEQTLRPVTQTEAFKAVDKARQDKLNTIFQYFYTNPTEVSHVEEIRAVFRDHIDGFDAGALFNNLPNNLYYAILDYADKTPWHSETVSFEATANWSDKKILKTFVEQAQRKRQKGEALKLGFITAAARDPFNSVKYYQQTFLQIATSIGIEDVEIVWLPFDIGLTQLTTLKTDCDELETLRTRNNLFNASARYPDLAKQQKTFCDNPQEIYDFIMHAHGVFISDGQYTDDRNQVRLLSLFSQWDIHSSSHKNTRLTQLLQQKFISNQIVMAGDGAGAIALTGGIFNSRPIPMITGGTSDVALIRGPFALKPVPSGCEKDGNCPFGILEDDLTYERVGGAGMFNLGIVDSNFSELGRQARLAVLAASTKTRFSFGIDKNTALLVSENNINAEGIQLTQFEVIGENGLMILDMRDAIFKTQSGKHQIIGLHHYLNNEDTFAFNNTTQQLSFKFAENSKSLSGKTLLLPRGYGEFRRNLSINCGTQSFHRWSENNIAWLINPSPDTSFYLNKTTGLENCSYNNLLFGVEN